MDKIKLWQNVSDNIEFFTYKTRNSIPEESGLYAWYLPVHVWDNDIFKTLDFIQKAMLYDSGVGGSEKNIGESIREKNLVFNWDKVKVILEKKSGCRRTDFKAWEKLKSNEKDYDLIKEAIMKSTIFSRPLYVGRTKNMKDRYGQHVKGQGSKFYERFNRFIEEYNKNNISKNSNEKKIPLKVSDLVFATLPIGSVIESHDKEITELVESILMNIIQPPFSRN